MSARPDLTLYHFAGCPYCGRVQRALRNLGLEIAQRDIHQDPEARQALEAAMGRGTVPVLQISEAEGGARWLPESADIVRYLYAEQGQGRPPFWLFLSPLHVVMALAVLWWLLSRWL